MGENLAVEREKCYTYLRVKKVSGVDRFFGKGRIGRRTDACMIFRAKESK